MSSSATGVGMPICFLGAILLILTQKSSQKFGDVLGIMRYVSITIYLFILYPLHFFASSSLPDSKEIHHLIWRDKLEWLNFPIFTL